MLIYAISLLAGAWSLELLQQLPSTPVLVFGLFICGAGYCLPALRLSCSFIAGFAVMGLAAEAQLDDQLDAGFLGESVNIRARVHEFPQIDGESMRLLVRPIGRPDLPRILRLSWFQAQARPVLGEVWQLTVRLRRPRGYSNPGGFDYEGWLFRQGIGATGYVVGEQHNYVLIGEPATRIDQMRRQVVRRIAEIAPHDDAAAVLMAIAVGARHEIGRSQWGLYASTGTSHLMAISGLHIGLAAGSAYAVSWFVFAPLFRRRNLRSVAILAAIMAAALYAGISGFAVPARRALLMAVIVAIAVLNHRRVMPAQLLGTTALLIFLSEPLAILTPGFKLSFAAVAILFFVVGHSVTIELFTQPRFARQAAVGVKRLCLLQIALLTGLFPLTVLIFGRFAMTAPLVNLLVLPVFNFVTVPLSLVGMLMDGPFQFVGDRLLLYAHKSIRLVLWIVEKAGTPEFTSFRISKPGLLFIVCVPLLHVVLPPGWPGRRLAFIAIISVICHRPAPPDNSCLVFHALDVGQGLAIVIQTRNHSLLFDTGPSFRNGSNAAELVVVPFLEHVGVDKVDRVIVSHGDLDHAGGIGTVISGVNVGEVLVGEHLENIEVAQTQCVGGEQWKWDGIIFRIIHPRRDAPWTGNNSSCVLEIDTGSEKILLAGDIESPVEQLLAYRAAFRKSHAVFVPHHGSRTSSGPALINSTRPEIAVISAGYDNRWGFPKEDVVHRWRQAGANVLNTANSGAISQRLCRHAPPGPVLEERHRSAKYWHNLVPERP